MRQRLRVLLSLLLAASAFTCAGLALAQSQPSASSPTRVVIMPFDANSSVATYQLGLPTALQRALNEIPGVYVPAVGDVALVMQKAQSAGKGQDATVRTLFSPDAVVQGTVAGSGSAVTVTLTLDAAGNKQTLSARTTDGNPATLARDAAKKLAQALRPDVGATVLGRIDAAAAQTPSLPSLGPVALAASRLPGTKIDDLKTASQLDPGSAWVQAEYARLMALGGDAKGALPVAQAAAKAQPDDVEVEVVLGVVEQAAGDNKAATAAFQTAVRLNPANAVALTGLAGLESDPAKAKQLLQSAIAAYPRMLDAYLQLANLQDTPQHALQTLRGGENALPGSVSLRSAIVQQVLKLGDDKGALTYLQQAVQDPMASSAGVYSLARLLPADVTDGALALVREGEKKYPDAVVLKAAEGELLVHKGDYAGAEGVLSPLHAQLPKDSAISNLLTVAQARQGKMDAAKRTFESVAGSGDAAQGDLARIFLSAGRAEAALGLLKPVVDKGTQDPQILTVYGLALARVGKLDEAEKQLNDALKIQPKLPLAERGLSFLKQQRQLTGGADVSFTAEAGTAFQQGIYALEVQDYQAAAQAFERTRQLDDNGLAAFFEGYALQLTGDPRSATVGYQAALKAFPNSDIILNDLGYAHLQLGRYDLALEQLDKAVSANPNNAQAHLNLGLTYYALGRYSDALKEFDAAVKLDPNLQSSVSQVRQDAQKKANGQ
ncbi:MAG TPA: tetratricopeptide repeat protein [Trueperaceae bacterium]|nr:tetratricopeptide repeat protein [Trueperaceae bacterium]